MTDDPTRGANSEGAPPDQGASGDVSTTGHSGREVGAHANDTASAMTTTGHGQSAFSQHGGHDGIDELDELDDDGHSEHDDHRHGAGHGGHGDDTSDVPTIVPTTWRQLVFPALILLLVAILVAGPITNAFQSRPAPLTTQQDGHGGEGKEQHGTEPTHSPGQPEATPEDHGSLPVTTVEATRPPLSASTAANLVTPTPLYDIAATKTAVALAAAQGQVARVPVNLEFGGTNFVVKAGNTLLPDWRPPQDQGIATWIEGSVANHILYLPYTPENAAIFQAGKKGDKMRLLMNTGQTFEFEVTRSERVQNGPPTQSGQFTVTTAMAQDHAGVTLFLIGDSTPDRAVVQAEFTGNIE